MHCLIVDPEGTGVLEAIEYTCCSHYAPVCVERILMFCQPFRENDNERLTQDRDLAVVSGC